MQYWRTMMRMLIALTVVATLAGCDDKKDAAAVAPAPTPTTTAMPAASGTSPASGVAVAPSSGADVAGAASGTSATPETHKGDKGAKPGTATKSFPPPGVMPHGNPEDGTLRYNPPPGQNPPAKKDSAH